MHCALDAAKPIAIVKFVTAIDVDEIVVMNTFSFFPSSQVVASQITARGGAPCLRFMDASASWPSN